MFPFRVNYQLTQKEFLKLSLITRFKRWQTWVISALAVYLIFLGLLLERNFHIIMGSVALLITPMLLVLRAIIIFKRFPYMLAPGTYEFSEDAILVSRGGIEVRIPWSHFKKIKYAGGFMTIKISDYEGLMLPVSLFETHQLNLVQRKVGS